MNQVKDSLKEVASTQPVRKLRSLFNTLAHGEDENYEQFYNRGGSGEMVTFRENDSAFRLFGTGVHVKTGAYITGVIGLTLTICFCFVYSVYHSRGTGRNEFIDHIELVDLIAAFVIGIPCHILLMLGVYQERKILFGPFLIYYAANFFMNIVFTFLTVISVALDFHRQLFGNIRLDLWWTLFQLAWTGAQALAMYVVFKCRRYIAARRELGERTIQYSGDVSSFNSDGVSVTP